MRKIENLKIELDETLEEKLKVLYPSYNQFRILKKTIDARRFHPPHFLYTIEFTENHQDLPEKSFRLEPITKKIEKPIIVGTGPAGLFAALRFVERGVQCLLIERGSPVEKRILKINRFWRYGDLDLNDNVCFGEGGAGLYSDGKLITRIKSEHIAYVMNRLVQFGAPKEIEYLSNPHIGSDRIRRLIPPLRQFLLKKGCEIYFNSKVDDLIINNNNRVEGVQLSDGRQFYSSHIILATGHSAEDIFDLLQQKNVYLEGKDFALGLRIEHSQAIIDKIQYRQWAGHPALQSATYRLTHHNKKQNFGVYTFCMCPGGFIVSSATQKNQVVSNGMSNYLRNSKFANSAIVVTVSHEKEFSKNVFSGLEFRKNLEKKAFELIKAQGGTKELPAQKLIAFLQKKDDQINVHSSLSGALPARLDQLFSLSLYKQLCEGIEQFDKKMKGFISDSAQVFGVETRTSCPIRITRHKDTLESLSHSGLYPCGEGSGYAGGITSSACDGIKVADKIISLY